jgi:microcystin-dependent protein
MLKTPSKTSLALMAAVLVAVPALLCADAYASDPFIGEIKLVGFNFAPRGYAFCDGQLLSISSNSALFALLGTTYGGDGRTTFALPDIRGRSTVHPGTGPGLAQIRHGEKSGNETTALTVGNLPPHNHQIMSTDENGNVERPGNAIPARDPREDQYATGGAVTPMRADMVSNTGSGQPFTNRPPYIGIYHVIALQGIFPSRN